jgi:hypothetical protein
LASLQQFGRAHSTRAGRSFTRVLLLSSCLVLLGAESLVAQSTSSCGSSDWFVVQESQREGSSLSPLCRRELDAAEDCREAAETELKAVITSSPQSASAYAAHSTLTRFYLRLGRFGDANAQILCDVCRPTCCTGSSNVRSLFVLLAHSPDLAIISHRPAIVHTHVIDGNLFAPVTMEGSTRAYMLDTGLNLAMMSESEAKSLG